MQLKKAERKQAKLRLALTGPSGSGKTMGGLILARSIGKRIAVIDTERGSASLYAHLCDFDVIDLEPPYSPERFIQAIKIVEQGDYDVLLIDSITHEWNGIGGCLEINDTLSNAKFRGNSWAAWNETTPRHRKFIDTMLQSTLHIIATMRSKTETAQIDEGGKKKVIKLGMKSEQRDGNDYEFTTVLDVVNDGHYATSSKDRMGLFTGDPEPITDKTGKKILAWLNEGVDPSKEVYEKALHAIEQASGDDAKLAKIRQAVLDRVSEGRLNHDQGERLIAMTAVEAVVS